MDFINDEHELTEILDSFYGRINHFDGINSDNINIIIRTNDIFKNLYQENIVALSEKIIKVAKIVRDHVIFDKSTLDIWIRMIVHCVYAFKEFTDMKVLDAILVHLFSAKGIDCRFVYKKNIDFRYGNALYNAVEMVIPLINEPSELLEIIFSHESLPDCYNTFDFCSTDKKPTYDILAYDDNFNRIFDDMICSLETAFIGMNWLLDVKTSYFMNALPQNDYDWVQYIKGKPIDEFEDKIRVMTNVFIFILELRDPFHYFGDNEKYYHNHICIDSGNITALTYLIASERDHHFTFKEELHCSKHLNDIFHRCFIAINNNIVFGEHDKIKNSLAIKNMVRNHIIDPKKSIREAKKKVDTWNFKNPAILALIVCVCDNIFIVDGHDERARFFRIACRLPLEIQTILVNRAGKSTSDIITSCRVNRALEKIFSSEVR